MRKILSKTLMLVLALAMIITTFAVPVTAQKESFPLKEITRYQIEDNSYISGAKPDYKVSQILGDFTSGDTYKVYDGDTEVSVSTFVKTGLEIKNTATGESVYTVLKGDLVADGKISTSDYIKVKKAFKGDISLTGINYVAADFNSDTVISSNDYLLLKRAFSGEEVYSKSVGIELNYIDFTEVKNVIYMIGDGMGPNHIDLAREKTGGNVDGKMYMDFLPNVGMERTYSSNSAITDSAAAGTALATGYKTQNGVIGQDRNGSSVQNIRELCASLGMKTGVITTKNINDATPAAFTAHESSRDYATEIAKDQIMDLPDVLIGHTDAGYDTALADTTMKEKLATYDVRRMYLPKRLYNETTSMLFGTLRTTEDVDLKLATENTLNHLDKIDTNDEGFFLMIEGGKIDTYSHNNQLDFVVNEVDEFDECVGLAMEYVLNNPDTLLIVTSDHETGGLQADGTFTTGNHTSADCKVMAIGYGTEVFNGATVNNTDIPKFIARSLGVNDFGDESIGYMETATTPVTYYSSEHENVLTLASQSTVAKVIQGGYTDGQYYYQAFIQKDTASDEENNQVSIAKFDFATGRVVKVSELLKLNHANDITMNTKTNELIVCHNNPNRKKLSILDPDTLTVKRTVELERKIFSIDYNENRDCYVIGIAGGQKFAILDSNFNEIAGPFSPTSWTKGYTTQGVTCNDDYICFVLFNPNVITVYNWEGEFVTVITLDDLGDEPENLSIVGDKLYVGVSTSAGLKVYDITVKKETVNVFMPK